MGLVLRALEIVKNYNGKCKGTSMELTCILQLGGCDMVLGDNLWRTLGDVMFNLVKLCSLSHKGNNTTLKGISSC